MSVFHALSAGKTGQPAIVGPVATVGCLEVGLGELGSLRAVAGGAVATGWPAADADVEAVVVIDVVVALGAVVEVEVGSVKDPAVIAGPIS